MTFLSEPSPLPILFAPLQGYTDLVYRNTHAQLFGGVHAYYMPFIRLENGTFRNKEWRESDPVLNRADSVPQLIASDATELQTIASLLCERGHTRIDINLGCPFPLQARKYRGAGILPYPDKVAALLTPLAGMQQIHFSVKMRLGWDSPDEWQALLPLLNDLPLHHITLHPRRGRQQYKGSVDMESFGRFCDACVHPVYYNGDLHTPQDLDRIVSCFPRLAGVMIGRGLLAAPWLARQYQSRRTIPVPTLRQQLARFHETLLINYQEYLQGEHQLLTKMKTVWDYFLPDADPKLRKKIAKSTCLATYKDFSQTLLRQYNPYV